MTYIPIRSIIHDLYLPKLPNEDNFRSFSLMPSRVSPIILTDSSFLTKIDKFKYIIKFQW